MPADRLVRGLRLMYNCCSCVNCRTSDGTCTMHMEIVLISAEIDVVKMHRKSFY